MKANEMLELLREFHRDKLTERLRHGAVARHVTDYNINNTYQYIINREEAHLAWLEDAIRDMGGEPHKVDEPEVSPPGKGKGAADSLFSADRDASQQFFDKWTHRIDGIPNARHRSMLRVILGEALELKRFFEQALAGREDLLGRRADGMGTPGKVLSTRWVG